MNTQCHKATNTRPLFFFLFLCFVWEDGLGRPTNSWSGPKRGEGTVTDDRPDRPDQADQTGSLKTVSDFAIPPFRAVMPSMASIGGEVRVQDAAHRVLAALVGPFTWTKQGSQHQG